MSYLFGDNELAARRLRRLARVFEASTLPFLQAERDVVELPDEPTVLDLGCGPGHTTRLLARVFATPVVGLDSSESFLWEARRLGPSRVSFRYQDVCRPPLVGSPADLIYTRFLLAHLEQAPSRIASWCAELKPGGRVLVEEVENIHTENEVFDTYLSLVATALRQQRSELYIGSELARIDVGGTAERTSSAVRPLQVSDYDAARMFALNLPTIRESERVRKAWDAERLDQLQEELDLLAHTPGNESRIRWEIRQIAWRRRA